MSPEAWLVERLEQNGQGHLLRWWNELDDAGQARLAAELASIDFGQLERLIADLVHGEGEPAPPAHQVGPIEAGRRPRTDGERVALRRAAAVGGDAIAAGEVGVILVAGGSGTRLGFEGPKGTFPIGPVSSASLFQIHAEKVVALSRRFGRTVPLYVMTSPENHEATGAFFDGRDRFSLHHVRFFL